MEYDPQNEVYAHSNKFDSGLLQSDSILEWKETDEPNTPFIGKAKNFDELVELLSNN